ncbi:MAG: hypothetical protein ACN4GZ_14600 [Acidimicrobiales bacterium]
MGSVELTGLVDPSQPMDPAAKRALAAREIKRFGPTPGTPPDPTVLNWTDRVRISFAGLENETACEILDCALDPAYSSSERPAGADLRITVFVERAVAGSGLPDRLHAMATCPDALPGQTSNSSRAGSIWNLTAEMVPCPRCLADPNVAAAHAIRGRERHRVNIRTDIFHVLGHLHQGRVAWPGVERLANMATERWAPRWENGYVDRGNPERWPADPVASALVELAVAVGHATGGHLAALWDAAMIDVLASHARNRASGKIRRKAGKALAAALRGHSWEELSGVVATEIDTAMTRRSTVEKRVSAVLAEFEQEIGAVVADELEALEQPGGAFVNWSSDLTSATASDAGALRSRLVMAWHGGPVPPTVLRAIEAYPTVSR